ncbi:MAG: nucleotidyltransferase domain-containing protein [Deltaproteobacteria bacterium]|nr:nucleotidyltransferase domain-containing protein [Deltaproteobacteria bacterium]
MADQKDRKIVYQTIRRYIEVLRQKQIPIWRVYLFGSYAKNIQHPDSDIDLAVFWDKEDINGFDENLELMKLTRDVDLKIEPHAFAKTDFDEPDPFVNEIITTGERII